MRTATKATGSHFEGLLSTSKKTVTTQTMPHGSVEPGKKNKPPLAKSRDPEFRAASLYLRKKTLAECEYQLKSTEDNRDMSELVEELMVAWLTSVRA